VLAHRLEQHVGAPDVGLPRVQWRAIRRADLRLRGQVKDRPWGMLRQGSAEGAEIGVDERASLRQELGFEA
jgi:hypothetical protein